MAENDDSLPSQVGARLRRLRETKAMNLIQFGDFLGIESNRYHSYESGRRLLPPKIANHIKELTGVTTDWIYANDPSGLSAQTYQRLVPLQDQVERAELVHAPLSEADIRILINNLMGAATPLYNAINALLDQLPRDSLRSQPALQMSEKIELAAQTASELLAKARGRRVQREAIVANRGESGGSARSTDDEAVADK